MNKVLLTLLILFTGTQSFAYSVECKVDDENIEMEALINSGTGFSSTISDMSFVTIKVKKANSATDNEATYQLNSEQFTNWFPHLDIIALAGTNQHDQLKPKEVFSFSFHTALDPKADESRTYKGIYLIEQVVPVKDKKVSPPSATLEGVITCTADS